MIELKDVSMAFKNTIVLKNVSLTLEKNHCYGFVGRNGSGKSILFKAICGLLPTSSGTVLVDGQQIGKDMEYIHNAGVLIETPQFVPGWTGYENLRILADIQKKIGEQEIMEVLKQVGLADAHNKKVKQYSLGMKQRLRIAQAIMEKPSYYILDEPFNGLDASGVEEMHELFTQLKKEDCIILMTSHDERDIEALADQVFQIEEGRVKTNEK